MNQSAIALASLIVDILDLSVNPLAALISKIKTTFGVKLLPLFYKGWHMFGVIPSIHII